MKTSSQVAVISSPSPTASRTGCSLSLVVTDTNATVGPRDSISPLVGTPANNSLMEDRRDTRPKPQKLTYTEQPTFEPPRSKGGARQIWNQCKGCPVWYAMPYKQFTRGRQLYCSIACCARHAKATGKFAGDKNPRWLGGVSSDNMRYQRRALERHPVECDARRQVNLAVARGDLVPEPCPCGSAAKTQGHHDDYSKPLEVRWLCPAHHMEQHRLETA